MALPLHSEEAKILRKMIPLENHPNSAFKDLCAAINIEQIEDDFLFRMGDTRNELIYLLTGSVTLQGLGLIVEVVEAKSESARFALAHQIPRKIDALANGMVKFVRLNAELVNNPPPADYQEIDSSYTIIEESDSDADDWLNMLLRLPLFQRLPPKNLQKLLVAISSVHFTPGDIIFDGGDKVEHLNIISKGQCVSVRPGQNSAIERRIGPGEFIGEDYLILDIASREKMIASTDVTLLQLDRDQFAEHISTPLLNPVSGEQADELIQQGALLLDVRQKQVAEKAPLDNGIHIPYTHLASKLGHLDKQRKIICSADEKTSQLAALILSNQEFEVYCLNDGSEMPEPEALAEFPPKPLTRAATPITPSMAKLQETPGLLGDASTSGNQEEESHENPGGKDLDPRAELRFLRMENKRLSAYSVHLEKKVTRLKMEKQKAEMRAKLLSLQMKKMKELMLNFSKK